MPNVIVKEVLAGEKPDAKDKDVAAADKQNVEELNFGKGAER